jgi:hypothetical protein
MKRTILFILSSISLALAGPQIGDPAPNFALPSSNGKTVTLEDFKGKIVYLSQGKNQTTHLPMVEVKIDKVEYAVEMRKAFAEKKKKVLLQQYSYVNTLQGEYFSFPALVRERGGSEWQETLEQQAGTQPSVR